MAVNMGVSGSGSGKDDLFPTLAANSSVGGGVIGGTGTKLAKSGSTVTGSRSSRSGTVGGASAVSRFGPFPYEDKFAAGLDEAYQPYISDSEIIRAFGGRIRNAADAGAAQAIQSAARHLGSTDSAAFQLASTAALGGAKVAAAEGINNALLQKKAQQRQDLLAALGLTLNRFGAENAARSIENQWETANRSLDIQEQQAGANNFAAMLSALTRLPGYSHLTGQYPAITEWAYGQLGIPATLPSTNTMGLLH
jgi:hypothetical protein